MPWSLGRDDEHDAKRVGAAVRQRRGVEAEAALGARLDLLPGQPERDVGRAVEARDARDPDRASRGRAVAQDERDRDPVPFLRLHHRARANQEYRLDAGGAFLHRLDEALALGERQASQVRMAALGTEDRVGVGGVPLAAGSVRSPVHGLLPHRAAAVPAVPVGDGDDPMAGGAFGGLRFAVHKICLLAAGEPGARGDRRADTPRHALVARHALVEEVPRLRLGRDLRVLRLLHHLAHDRDAVAAFGRARPGLLDEHVGHDRRESGVDRQDLLRRSGRQNPHLLEFGLLLELLVFHGAPMRRVAALDVEVETAGFRVEFDVLQAAHRPELVFVRLRGDFQVLQLFEFREREPLPGVRLLDRPLGDAQAHP